MKLYVFKSISVILIVFFSEFGITCSVQSGYSININDKLDVISSCEEVCSEGLDISDVKNLQANAEIENIRDERNSTGTEGSPQPVTK